MTTMKNRVAGLDARTIAAQFGASRSLIGAAILAAPVPAARVLGADSATAARVTWLTRMMGVRDAAIGVGTYRSARSSSGTRGFLLAGAVCDAVDAVVLAGAIKQGRLRGLLPSAVVAGAAFIAVAGAVDAVALGRG